MNLQQLIAREELILPILLHLPLNVLWRLPGWNKLLNKWLMREHFWRLKVEREFILRLEKVPNYRLYYLMCSTNCYGRLYDDKKRMTQFNRVRGIYLFLSGQLHPIIWEGDTLYATFYGEYVPYVDGVTYFRDGIYHKNGKTYMFVPEGMDEEGDPEGIDTVELSEQLVLRYEDTGNNVLALFTDGTLEIKQHYDPNERTKVTNHFNLRGVIDVDSDHDEIIRVLFSSGELVRYQLTKKDGMKEIGESIADDSPYVKLEYFYSYRFDGFILNDSAYSTKKAGIYKLLEKEVRSELPYPIRTYGPKLSIGIDGRGFLPHQRNNLSSESSFKGIISVTRDERFTIASLFREKQY